MSKETKHCHWENVLVQSSRFFYSKLCRYNHPYVQDSCFTGQFVPKKENISVLLYCDPNSLHKRKMSTCDGAKQRPVAGRLGDMHAYEYFPLGPCPFSAVSPVFHFQSINFIFIRMSSSIHQYMWSFGWLGLISTEFLNATFKSFTSSLLAPSHFK